jgi:hypothetical protein
MADNLRHWNALGKTDPKHTKPFSRAGGFKGTATKPIWLTMRLTEHFGPCGLGWGMTKPEFQTVTAGDEILVFCTVGLWYIDAEDPDTEMTVYGVGGDKVLTKRASGPFANDEAFKAAYTDALSNAMKQIGVGADIHMGLFDDNKYVAETRKEFAEHEAAADKPKPAPAPARETPGKFELLDADGKIAEAYESAEMWCHGLREAITAEGARVAALWQMNATTAQVIYQHYPDVVWAGKTGRKVHAVELLEAKVNQLLPGLAA